MGPRSGTLEGGASIGTMSLLINLNGLSANIGVDVF